MSGNIKLFVELFQGQNFHTLLGGSRWCNSNVGCIQKKCKEAYPNTSNSTSQHTQCCPGICQWFDGKCLMTSFLVGGWGVWFVVFHGANAPAMVIFKLPMQHHCQWSGEQVCTISSHKVSELRPAHTPLGDILVHDLKRSEHVHSLKIVGRGRNVKWIQYPSTEEWIHNLW